MNFTGTRDTGTDRNPSPLRSAYVLRAGFVFFAALFMTEDYRDMLVTVYRLREVTPSDPYVSQVCHIEEKLGGHDSSGVSVSGEVR